METQNREKLILEYIEITIKHNREVYDLMFLIFKNINKLSFTVDRYQLLYRGVKHDTDKFNEKFINAVVDIVYFKNAKTSEELLNLNEILDNHKDNNSHHLQNHIKNNTEPSNEDICEMCCDWISAVKKYEQIDDDIGKAREYLIEKCKEFSFLENYRNKFFEVFNLILEIR